MSNSSQAFGTQSTGQSKDLITYYDVNKVQVKAVQ